MSGAYDDALTRDRRAGGARGDARTPSGATPAGWRSTGSASRSRCARPRRSSATSTRPAGTRSGAVIDASASASVEALKPVVMVERRRRSPSQPGRRADRRLRSRPVCRASRRSSATRAGSCSATARGCSDASASAEAVRCCSRCCASRDPRVAREAIAALGAHRRSRRRRARSTRCCGPPPATLRRAVIDALVADRDPRVVPMLVRILDESQPLGKDHESCSRRSTRSARSGSDDGGAGAAQPSPATARWFGRKKLRALKERGVDALAADRQARRPRPRSRRPRGPATAC